MSVVQAKVPPMQVSQRVYLKSSIGRKVLMAVTGLIQLGFVSGHMIGNLQIFIGQNQLNAYAQALKDLPALTWSVRTIVLASFIIHIWNAVRLYFENRASRPIRYVINSTVQASLASRTMFWTGLGILLYVVYHLLQFTFIVTNPQYAHLTDAMGRHDVYSMVVLGFQNYIISGVYIVALFLLFYHLTHAIFSMLQTLGLNKPRVQPTLKVIGYIISVAIFVGYVSIPVAVLVGIINLPAGGH